MYKVSIIIPVFNGEKFLERCLLSIINQTYKNIEIIVINDGSTDQTLNILKKYTKKYSIIKVYNQKNLGSASARNNGISHVKSKFITFIDSDDFVDANYIETLVENIGDNDFIVSGYKSCTDSKILYIKKPWENDIWSAFKYIATCGKLYKTSFIKKYNIQFLEKYKIGEDVYFTINAITNTNKIKTIRYAGYTYYVNPLSVTHTANKNKQNRNIKMIALLEKLAKDIKHNKYTSLYLKELNYFFLKTFVFYLEQQRHILSLDEYFLEYKKCFEIAEKISLKYTNKKLKLFWIKNEEFKVNLICNLFIFFRKIHMEKLLLFLLKIF